MTKEYDLSWDYQKGYFTINITLPMNDKDDNEIIYKKFFLNAGGTFVWNDNEISKENNYYSFNYRELVINHVLKTDKYIMCLNNDSRTNKYYKAIEYSNLSNDEIPAKFEIRNNKLYSLDENKYCSIAMEITDVSVLLENLHLILYPKLNELSIFKLKYNDNYITQTYKRSVDPKALSLGDSEENASIFYAKNESSKLNYLWQYLNNWDEFGNKVGRPYTIINEFLDESYIYRYGWHINDADDLYIEKDTNELKYNDFYNIRNFKGVDEDGFLIVIKSQLSQECETVDIEYINIPDLSIEIML